MNLEKKRNIIHKNHFWTNSRGWGKNQFGNAFMVPMLTGKYSYHLLNVLVYDLSTNDPLNR